MSGGTALALPEANGVAPAAPGRGTRFPELFALLAAEFHPNEVKARSGGGNRQLHYITARTAMIRLDEVLGPENWEDEYFTVADVLFCRITVTLPDGTRVQKCDAGGFKEMREGGKVDEENTDKTGPSDAFKRAAAKFGVGRYLYKDGTADFAPPPPPPPAKNNSGHGKGAYASPAQVQAYEDALRGWLDKKNGQWSDSWPPPALDFLTPKDTAELLSAWQANGHLVKWAVESGRLDPGIIPEDCKPSQKPKYIAVVYHRSPGDRKALGLEMERYATEQADRRRQAIYAKHPELRPDGYDDGGDVPDEFLADDAFEPGRE